MKALIDFLKAADALRTWAGNHSSFNVSPLTEAFDTARAELPQFAVCENRACDMYAVAYVIAGGHVCKPITALPDDIDDLPLL